MKIEEAKMWREAHVVAEGQLAAFAVTDGNALDTIHAMIMCAYVEGVKDAQDYQKGAT